MHYHCEIVLPPTEDVETAVTQVMEQFDENSAESSRGFWDYWTIGGRWSGDKYTSHLDQKRLEKFHKELNERKVTISGVVCGKEELSPAEQIPVVDELWQKYFPGAGPCQLFKHSGERLPGDIMKLGEIDASRITCHRVIFAKPQFEAHGVEAGFMVAQDIWNGCNYERTAWDCTLKHALELHAEDIERCSDAWKLKVSPQPDWLVVTVDYHS